MFNKWILCSLFLTPLTAEEIRVEVQDPVYKDGVLSTDKGGVINIGKMRIQGREMKLTEENGEKILRAKGDLFLTDEKKFFIGDAFSYNLSTKQGLLENGVCNVERFFIGGQTINFKETGALNIEKAFVTASENKTTPWSIKAKTISLDEKNLAKAQELTPAVGQTPFFYLPSYSMGLQKNLKKSEPPIQYQAAWEQGQGLFILRSKVLDTHGLKLFLRGEYRLTRGAGTALEIAYKPSENSLYSFSSNNFYAYDTFSRDLNKRYSIQFNSSPIKSRYRIQGSTEWATKEKTWEASVKWDALSDRNVRADFPKVFESQSFGKTEGSIKGYFDSVFTSLYARPRINAFQGFKQELPTLTVAVKPYVLPFTGTIFENTFKLAYLDYVYTDKLATSVANFGSGRLESSHFLSQPLHFGPIHATPKMGFQEIYYTSGPKQQDHFQALFHYNLSSFTSVEKSYAHTTHEIKPYFEFKGLTEPTAKMSDVYIFSIQDGYHTLNQLKVGLKNSFFSHGAFFPLPRFSIDSYAYHFYNTKTFAKAFPKGYLDLSWNYPNLSFQTNFGWNFQKNRLDHTNFSVAWTLNEYFAASFELRNRGPYEWRKDIFSNYLIDIAKPIDELAKTPLSDERTTLLMRWQIQISPLWNVQIANHLGKRPGQPFYHESKIDLYTTLMNTWKLRLSYARTNSNNEYSFGLNLLN